MIITRDMLKDQESAKVINRPGSGGIVFVCEHASNFIPQEFDRLGLTESQVESHIAWDPGALAVAQLLSEKFDAPLIYSDISRLIYDCNRPPNEPSAIAVQSEVHFIPGNADLTEEAIKSRIELVYKPFVQAVDKVVGELLERGTTPYFVTIHSFSPSYNGAAREVEVGILHDKDKRFADNLLNHCDSDTEFEVRRNEPYGPSDGVTHTLQERAQSVGIPNVMIEIRNDLIQNEKAINQMGRFLTELLKSGISDFQVVNQQHN